MPGRVQGNQLRHTKTEGTGNGPQAVTGHKLRSQRGAGILHPRRPGHSPALRVDGHPGRGPLEPEGDTAGAVVHDHRLKPDGESREQHLGQLREREAEDDRLHRDRRGQEPIIAGIPAPHGPHRKVVGPAGGGGVRVLARDGDLLGNRPVPGGEGQRRGHRDTLQGVGSEQGDDHVRK